MALFLDTTIANDRIKLAINRELPMPKDPRNKQVIVRMTDDDRERFKEFCKDNDLEVSGFLCELVRRFNDGSLTLAHIQVATDSDIDSKVVADLKKSLAADLAEMVRNEVQQAIAIKAAEYSKYAEEAKQRQLATLKQNQDTDVEKSSTTVDSEKGKTREKLADDFGTNSNYVSQAIAALTPTSQTPITGVETTGHPVTLLDIPQADQSVNVDTLPLSDGGTQGDLLEVETAIKPSGVPSWLEVGKEYKQIDFVEKTGCSKSTVSDALTGRKPPQNPDLALLVELKKAEKLIKTMGGKWIYKPE